MPDTDNPLIASLIEAEQIARGERQPAKVHTVYVNPTRCHVCGCFVNRDTGRCRKLFWDDRNGGWDHA